MVRQYVYNAGYIQEEEVTPTCDEKKQRNSVFDLQFYQRREYFTTSKLLSLVSVL